MSQVLRLRIEPASSFFRSDDLKDESRDWWGTGIDFANIELSFGPSWQYAELELRGRLDRVSIKEDERKDIIDEFKKILQKYTYAMEVDDDSRPEGSNTGYPRLRFDPSNDESVATFADDTDAGVTAEARPLVEKEEGGMEMEVDSEIERRNRTDIGEVLGDRACMSSAEMGGSGL